MSVATGASRATGPRRLGPLVCTRPQARALTRLVCFAHAGGGPGAFRKWPMSLAPDVEVWTATLPGRAARSEEPFARSWEPLVEDLTDWLQPRDGEEPPALLGHSLGGLVAFEVARALERRGGPPPKHLFVTGCRAPHRSAAHWRLPEDDELVTEIDKRFGAVPTAVRTEAELLKRFIPILRADLELAAAYVWEPGESLSCPITALAGSEDRTAPPPEVERWGAQTRGLFEAVTLPGAHFFLHSELPTVAKLIRRALVLPAQQASGNPRR